MPIKIPGPGAGPALELGGKAAGALRSLQMAGLGPHAVQAAAGPAVHAPPATGRLVPTPFDAEFALAGPSPLLDWALTLPRRRDTRADGAALVTDGTGQVVRRLDWTGGLLTELRLPTLDATAAKQPFTIGIAWLPEAMAPGAGGGNLGLPVLGKLKTLMLSNFRVTGLPFDGAGIGRVRLPTVRGQVVQHAGEDLRPSRLEAGGVELGTVDLEAGSAAGAGALRAWVHKAWQSGAMPALDLQVELLDTTLRKVRATLALGGCRLTEYAESRLQATQERLPMPALRFDVGSLDLKVVA